MEAKQSVKAIETYSLNVKFEGVWRKSPEYPTPEEAVKNLVPFIKQHKGQFLSVTIIRNTRYEAVK